MPFDSLTANQEASKVCGSVFGMQLLPEKYSYFRRVDRTNVPMAPGEDCASVDCVICMAAVEVSQRSTECMVCGGSYFIIFQCISSQSSRGKSIMEEQYLLKSHNKILSDRVYPLIQLEFLLGVVCFAYRTFHFW